MTAFTDLSDVINKTTGGNSGTPEPLFTWIDSRVAGAAANATVAGRLTSLWQYQKSRGGAGAVPTSSAIPTNATAGSLFQTDPGGGRQKFLTAMAAMSNTTAGTLLMYDRLVHMGGLDATVTTAQTTNLPTTTLTRNTSGEGNFILLEIYTQIGVTGTTATVSYKNGAGTTKTSQAVVLGGSGSREAQRGIIVPLADGDTSVKTIENLDLVATTGTAGNIGISICKPIASIPVSIGAGAQIDFISGLPITPEIETGACLTFLWMPASTTAPQIFFNTMTVES